MKLCDFIEANLDSLIGEWVEFAHHIMPADARLTESELADSARTILLRIAADMRTPQSPAQQKAKSRGEGRESPSGVSDVGHEHADRRLAQGYGLNEVVAEFRAMRASVLRRWGQNYSADAATIDQVVRFNEAIDQSLAESVRQYSGQVEATRDRFAGVLAHDLRSPLGAIANTAEFLLHEADSTPSRIKAAANLQRSAARMKRMVDDLLDFTRTRLGDRLPVEITPQDIRRLCSDASDEVSASFPQAVIEVCLDGDLAGNWDGGRISQLLANLLVNAIQHGSGPIRVSASEENKQVKIVVANGGRPIPKQALRTLFDPLTRSYSSPERRGTAAGIGLGLYICKCIAEAHGGDIAVSSNDNETAFTVTLPSPFSGSRG